MICYDCNSATDDGCGDPVVDLSVLEDYQVNCTGSCQKVKTTIFGANVYVRDCSDDCQAGEIDVNIVAVTTSCCTTDQCNGSASMATTLDVVIATVTLAALYINFEMLETLKP